MMISNRRLLFNMLIAPMLALICTVVVGCMGMVSLSQVNAQVTTIVADDMPYYQSLNNIRLDRMRIERDVRQALLLTDDAGFQAQLQTISTDQQTLLSDFAAYLAQSASLANTLDPRYQTIAEDYKTKLGQWFTTFQHIQSLLNEYTPSSLQQASLLIAGQWYAQTLDIKTVSTNADTLMVKSVAASQQSASAIFHHAIIGFLVILIAIVALTVILSIFIAHNISNRLRFLVDIIHQVAEGNLTIPLEKLDTMSGHSELGILAASTGKMVRNVQHMVQDLKTTNLQLESLFLHDSLTGLPNRLFLARQLEQILAHASESSDSTALLLLDLDRFREVNDTLGHETGDLLLHEVSARLRQSLRSSDFIARLGGDEFAVIFPFTPMAEAILLTQRLLATFHTPFQIQGTQVSLGANIGIAQAPDHGSDMTSLLRFADVAMYKAKRSAQQYVVYTPEIDQNELRRLSLISELHQGIFDGQFVLYYQPQISLPDETLLGVEALIRWRHPIQGLIPPDEFIPLAEQSGMIVPITYWVVNQALEQCKFVGSTGMVTAYVCERIHSDVPGIRSGEPDS
jgi:diguanylate cyclase (GGDEF)-like protein